MCKRASGREWVYVCVVLTVMVVFVAGGVWADPNRVVSAIDAASPNCKVVSEKIWEYKELGQQEFKSSQLMAEELRKLGYTVTGDLKVPADLVKDGVAKTALRAELKGKGPGPTITIMVEYDALKNGHACGTI